MNAPLDQALLSLVDGAASRMPKLVPRNEIQRALRSGAFTLPNLPDVKCPPDLLAMLDGYVDLLKKGEDYADKADDKWLEILAEVERLQVIEYDRDEQMAEVLGEMKKLTHYLLSACLLMKDEKARQKAQEAVKHADEVMNKMKEHQ